MRVIVYRFKQLLKVTESPKKAIVTAPPQPSWAVTVLVSGAGTRLAQLNVRLLEQVITGGVVSLTVMFWMQLELLPALSLAVHVRAMR